MMAANSKLVFANKIIVEILQKQNSLLGKEAIICEVKNWLVSQIIKTKDIVFTNFDNKALAENIYSISIYGNQLDSGDGEASVSYYVYSFNSEGPEMADAEDDQQISTHWILPTRDFHGLWDSLIYDSGVKDQLLNYVSTSLLFSEKCVDPNIISWNRLILLHGPPGTGKTSLCKALAQKICIRFSSEFSYGQLVEVNTHSLFSKWFSESGKLVTKMFHSILDLVEDPKALVIVLLDEVETLARSRSSALGGNEPSDALRVVNALLTHLDMIKRYPNVLILTTSNITDAIDVALIDRADIKQFIGLPSAEAIYQIFSSCILELQQTNIVFTRDHLVSLNEIGKLEEIGFENSNSKKLKEIAIASVGLSGRTLRKLPFIACSLFIQKGLNSLDVFLEALATAVEKHKDDVMNLKIHV